LAVTIRGLRPVARWTAIAAAAAVLLHAALTIMDSKADGLVLVVALMALGALLARLPLGPGLAVAAGLFGAVDAGLRLIGHRGGAALEVGYAVAALLLLTSGGVLLRSERPAASKAAGG